MAISKRMVRQFLERKLKDSAKAKRFTDRALDRKLAALDPEPVFVTKPYTHQKVCFLLATMYKGYVELLDMGLGKTKIILDLLAWFIDCERAARGLVLVPGIANVEGWLEEVAVHQPDLDVLGLTPGMKDRRERVLEGDYDLLVCTYAGYIHLTCGPRKDGKRGLEPLQRMAGPVERLFDLVCYDESTQLMNSRSLSFRLARRLKKTSRFRYALTGTPFDKDPQALWSQFFACDGGATLGKTLGLFRAAFFSASENYWSGYDEWTFKQSMRGKLARVIRHRSIRYSEEECLDLPQKITAVRPVRCPRETWAYYESLKEQLAEAKGNRRLVESLYMQARQVCAGWLKVKGDEGDTIIKFKENPKLQALQDLLAEIPEEEQVIVWNVYHVTGDILCERLGDQAVRLYGKTKDKAGVLRRFKEGKVRVLVASKAGAKGLNLQVANHCIFYETFDSAIDRSQAEKRIRRPGQTRRTHYWDLPMRGTVDEKILRSIGEGRDLLGDLIDGKEVL